MEKRLRNYIRHLEKIDFDVLSDEEIVVEREGLRLQINALSQELTRYLISAMAFLICGCIFLSAGLIGFVIIPLVCGGLFILLALFTASTYRKYNSFKNQFYDYLDKLTS